MSRSFPRPLHSTAAALPLDRRAVLFSDLRTRGRFDLAQAFKDSTIRVNQIGSIETLTIPLSLRHTWQWSTAVLCLRPVIEKVKRNNPSIRIVFEEYG